MEIPEITESQVKLMHEVCFDPSMNVFSQTTPLPSDDIEAAFQASRAAADADYLATLGFLENITANHLGQVQEMNNKTGRTWRVFKITPLARAMFQLKTPKTIH